MTHETQEQIDWRHRIVACTDCRKILWRGLWVDKAYEVIRVPIKSVFCNECHDKKLALENPDESESFDSDSIERAA